MIVRKGKVENGSSGSIEFKSNGDLHYEKNDYF